LRSVDVLRTLLRAGVDATNEAGGIDYMQWLREWATEVRGGSPGGNRLVMGVTERPVLDVFLTRLLLMCLEIIRDPQGASEVELAGVWATISISLSGRPAIATTLIEAGVLKVAVDTLQESSPTDWITWRTPTGILASPICLLGWTLSTLTLPNKTRLLLDTGLVDVAISVLKAFELRGVSKLHEANPCGIWAMMQMLGSLDLSAEVAEPIVRQLKGIPSALRFMLSHNLDHIKGIGQSTSAPCSAVCALAYGKDEGGEFVFDQAMVDAIVRDLSFWFAGNGAGFMPVLPPFFLRGVRCLCVSDVNKMLLVRCPDLVALITDMLLLDPEHARQNQGEAIKAAIQKDAAECFYHLALFDLGRQMLMQDEAAMETLSNASKDQTLTDEARENAYGAMMAVNGRAREPEPQPGQKHVMLSCESSLSCSAVHMPICLPAHDTLMTAR
jgi:hypothetical protein